MKIKLNHTKSTRGDDDELAAEEDGVGTRDGNGQSADGEGGAKDANNNGGGVTEK